MGMLVSFIKFMLAEHRYQPIRGEVLHIGKQTVHADSSALIKLFEEYGVRTDFLRKNLVRSKDKQTRLASDLILDHDLMASLGDVNYNCLDVSNYEGANIICNMNGTIPPEFVGKFDYIFDGSVLDNVFDPATFIKNAARLLRPGGRIILCNHSSAYPGAFVTPSPEWYYSFFAANGFVDCKVYSAKAVPHEGRFPVHVDLYHWRPSFTRNPKYSYLTACRDVETYTFCYVIAEKGPESTCDEMPIQMQYLGYGAPDWRLKEKDFDSHPRPLIRGERHDGVPAIFMESDHFAYMGRL